MRIVHCIGGSLKGGAALGVLNIHHQLKSIGIQSQIFTNDMKTDHIDVIQPKLFYYKRLIRIILKFKKKIRFYRNKNALYSPFRGAETENNSLNHADILNFHWVNDEFIDPKFFNELNVPYIITLRDMWWFTAGCHYNVVFNGEKCHNYTQDCSSCPMVKIDDNTKNFYIDEKRKILGNAAQVVAISHHVKEQFMISDIGRGIPVKVIENMVDPFYAQTFEHIQKTGICLGASTNSLYYKGAHIFEQILQFLNSSGIPIFVFGTVKKEYKNKYKNISFVGRLDKTALRNLYRSCQLFVGTSVEEAFGKTFIEAYACECRILGICDTAMEDIMRGLSGTKFVPFRDADSFVSAIMNEVKKERPMRNDVLKICERFTADRAAKEYKKLYKNVIINRNC